MTQRTNGKNGLGTRGHDGRAEQAVYDVVVVGGGAAGTSAALTLARARRSVLVIDGSEPRNAPAAAAHGFLTRDGTDPRTLIGIGRSEVETYGGHFVGGQVVDARREGDGGRGDGSPFVLLTDGGTVVRARRVLLAGGLVDELPAVAGVAERWGRDVLHCPYCHGWEVRHRAIGVLATGPNAVHMALVMGQWSPRVRLFRHDGFPLTEQDRAELGARGVDIVDGVVAGLHVVTDQLQALRMVDGRLVPCEALVVTPRFAAREELATALGARTAEHPAGVGRHVVTDPGTGLAAPGVWAAGNITDPMAQMVHAAGQGVQAAISINTDLVHHEVREALAAAGTSDAGVSP